MYLNIFVLKIIKSIYIYTIGIFFIYTEQYIFLACGQENIQTKVLIVNGTKVEYGTAPWNVGIYYRKDDTKEYDIICGGTLISLNLVVSGKYSEHT